MDIVLERILSLIPRKENGKFVHGAKKAFADKIGLNHPQIISDWIAERNNSYPNYLYAISAKYNVSVEWLKGETDDPTPLTGEGQKNSSTPEGAELSSLQREAMEFVLGLSEERLRQFIRIGKAMVGEE